MRDTLQKIKYFFKWLLLFCFLKLAWTGMNMVCNPPQLFPFDISYCVITMKKSASINPQTNQRFFWCVDDPERFLFYSRFIHGLGFGCRVVFECVYQPLGIVGRPLYREVNIIQFFWFKGRTTPRANKTTIGYYISKRSANESKGLNCHRGDETIIPFCNNNNWVVQKIN